VCVYVHMHTNSLCICIHTHTHTHTHTHLVCIPSTGITAFVFSTVPLLAFVVCFFVLCNRHYVIDTGSTGPRARRLAELGVSYLTPAVAQALAWVRSYLFFFFKTRTTRRQRTYILHLSAMVCRRLWPGPRNCSRFPAISVLSILTRLPGDRFSGAKTTRQQAIF